MVNLRDISDYKPYQTKNLFWSLKLTPVNW